MQNSMKKISELENLIGRTPMVEIHFKYEGKERKIYSKLEYFNYSGSIKDRMALNCIKRAYQNGDLKDGYTIAETTSGNTGIAFCAIGSYVGLESVIFMPDWMSSERKGMISSFGAKLHLVSKEEGGFLGCIDKTKEYGKEESVYTPDQFSNEYNTEAHYMTTGPEIIRQMDTFGVKPHGVVAGVGTGGTIMGIGRFLRSIDPKTKMFPMEPKSSPTLTTGHQVGKHRIAGISDEFIPDLLKLKECDNIIMVDDGDAIIMAQRLSRELGLGIGISSGANFLAAIEAQEIMGEGANIVTVFADDNKKYLSTDYVRTEPVKDDFLSPKVELIGFKTVRA